MDERECTQPSAESAAGVKYASLRVTVALVHTQPSAESAAGVKYARLRVTVALVHTQPATRERWWVSRPLGPFALPQECAVSLPPAHGFRSSVSSECGGRDPCLYAALGTAQGHLLGFPITLERIFCVLFGGYL